MPEDLPVADSKKCLESKERRLLKDKRKSGESKKEKNSVFKLKIFTFALR